MKMQSFVVTLVVFLVACGGGGSSSGGTDVPVVAADAALVPPCCPPLPPPPPIVFPPLPVLPPSGPVDVVFKNVPVSDGTVLPGQRNVEAVAFRMVWSSQGRKTFSQIVLQNVGEPVDLWETLQSVRLVSDGVDIRQEANYQILRDNVKQTVTIDFYGWPWYPDDFGFVPKTFSVLLDMKTSAPAKKFKFKLLPAQMHEYGVFAESDVVGGEFSIVKLGDAGLPVITTNSPAYFAVPASAIDTVMQVGKFKSFCPADDGTGCVLREIRFFVDQASPPSLNIGGNIFDSQKSDASNIAVMPVGYVVTPNDTVEAVISAIVRNVNVAIWITEMVWEAAGGIRVTPITPATPEGCGLIISDGINCKG